MLQNDLYTIDSLVKEEESATAILILAVSHPVFKGHFPGQPVLPGACMLQMIKELMELTTGNALQLHKAYHLKFIALIDPSKNNRLEMQLKHVVSEEGISVNATLLREADVCLKFSGIFTVQK